MNSEDCLSKYREKIVDTLIAIEWEYEKMIVYLSGGSIGISFTFLTDLYDILFKKENPDFSILYISWFLSFLSLAIILINHRFDIKAYEKTIDQIDRNVIYQEKPGGNYTRIVHCLNFVSGITCLLGIGFLITFIFLAQKE